MKLSIIIAAYNVEKHIEKCINSCVNQELDHKFYEIVVVNDGSIDNTGEILKSLENNIDNLKIINQPNAGLGASRNTGIKHSIGKHLWFIDGDDYLEINILKGITDKINKDNLDTLVLDYAVVDALYKITGTNLNELVGVKNVISGAEFYKYNYAKSYSWLFIFKRSLFVENNILFKERINMQDSEILPKLLYHCKRIAFLDKVCYYYVQHQNSFTNATNGEKRFNYFKSIIAVKNSLEEFSKQLGEEQASLQNGIHRKLEALHLVVFNHLISYPYKKNWLKKIIKLLRDNDYYPLKYQAKGKLQVLKFGMNKYPIFTKHLINFIKKTINHN